MKDESQVETNLWEVNLVDRAHVDDVCRLVISGLKLPRHVDRHDVYCQVYRRVWQYQCGKPIGSTVTFMRRWVRTTMIYPRDAYNRRKSSEPVADRGVSMPEIDTELWDIIKANVTEDEWDMLEGIYRKGMNVAEYGESIGVNVRATMLYRLKKCLAKLKPILEDWA